MPRLAAGLCFIALLATRSEAAVEAGPRAASPARPISPSSVATPCPNSCALVDYMSGSQDYSCSANPRADMTGTNTSASYDLQQGVLKTSAENSFDIQASVLANDVYTISGLPAGTAVSFRAELLVNGPSSFSCTPTGHCVSGFGRPDPCGLGFRSLGR